MNAVVVVAGVSWSVYHWGLKQHPFQIRTAATLNPQRSVIDLRYRMLSARKLLEMRHAARAIAALLLLVVVAVPILAVAFIAGGLDPFDRFEVIAIEAGQGSGLYTVSYRYHHADSSRDVYAIWVLSDSPPIGSTQPPPGSAEPVLVWTNDGDVVAVRWSEGRLAVTAKKGTDRRAGKLSDCYFEYDSAHLVCFDPRVAQVADEVGSR